MIGPRWLILRKRNLVLGLLGLLLLILLVWGAARLFSPEPKIIPEQVLADSLQKTAASRSFRYQVEARTGDGALLSQVAGEVAAPGRIHIKGTMYNSPVEFVQIGETTYMRDIWTKKWLTLEGNKLAQSDLFITEFKPLSFFNFKDVPVVHYRGREKLPEGNMLVLECQPLLKNPFFDLRYTTYNCKLWVEPGSYFIRRAVLDARGPGGKPGLSVTLKLWDFDRPLTINPPV
ncbi:hypothetical protein [Desulfotomaculum copahuensis]|uniref:Uncharacterized protein n=1 Tax=Desulfotomaculum copahuensis TaxID=1838280 RepID=A0A1B7LCF1_9FIRM|nr:hypothetical protein [Desulfotomaculum copahuensis]OAT80340.1 hypothetical protein A6M21_13695 [Desulfotomaculum copahuensis]